MGWIAFIRHGPTEWNERGLIQGRTDLPLSASGIETLTQHQPGPSLLAATWVTSPLVRARQTAAILNPGARAEIHEALIETNWGEFEGLPSKEIASRIRLLGLNPDHGIDLTPPAGESPRMVRRRLMEWLIGYAESHPAIVAVTHKGVIRSALSAACDWNMESDFDQKPDWTRPHLFEVGEGGDLRLMRLNCPWDRTIVFP